MAVLNFSGFETQSENEHESGTGTRTIETTIKRWGGGSLRVHPAAGATTGYVQMRKPTTAGTFTNISEAELFVGCWFLFNAVPAANHEPILTCHSGISAKAELRVNADRTLSVYDSAGTLIGTTTWAATLDQWYFIELSAATGSPASVTVRVDTVVVFSGTGNLTGTSNQQVRFGKWINRNSQGYNLYLDSHYLASGGFLGPVHVTQLLPTGAGTLGDWAGTFADIDEIPPSDVDYLLSTGVADEASTYLLQDLAAKGAILAVKVVGRAIRDGGTNGAYRLRMRSGGSDLDLAANATSGSSASNAYLVSSVIPGGADPWTKAAVNGLEVGVVEKDTNLTRISSLTVQVLHRATSPADSVAVPGKVTGLGIGIRVS